MVRSVFETAYQDGFWRQAATVVRAAKSVESRPWLRRA